MSTLHRQASIFLITLLFMFRHLITRHFNNTLFMSSHLITRHLDITLFILGCLAMQPVVPPGFANRGDHYSGLFPESAVILARSIYIAHQALCMSIFLDCAIYIPRNVLSKLQHAVPVVPPGRTTFPAKNPFPCRLTLYTKRSLPSPKILGIFYIFQLPNTYHNFFFVFF